jgi:hypothetical protein
MLRVPRVVANAYLHANPLDLVEQFDQGKVSLEKVRLSTKLGTAGILRLAE